MDFKLRDLLYNAPTGNLYRVIGVSEDTLNVIEYSNNHLNSDCEVKIFSRFNSKWYKWVNGAGQEIELVKVGPIEPGKIPIHMVEFVQFDRADSFIIDGERYKKVENNSLNAPDDWEGHKVYKLQGKKEALVCFKANVNRKSLLDSPGDCFMYVAFGDGAKTKQLKTQNVWIIKMA